MRGTSGLIADDKPIQRALQAALRAAGIPTMIYTHVLNRGGRGVVSPLDR